MGTTRAPGLLILLLTSCSSEPNAMAGAVPRASAEPLHAVEVVIPHVLRGLPLATDGGLQAVTPCTTCHGAIDKTPLPLSPDRLAGPHSGLTLQHGSLRCASCHDPERRDQLRLADGRSIALLDAMELCAQCHGPQKRDYDHGAHGGMRGHWDLRKGSRERNHCVACHDPHAPRFGTFMPVAGPRDRFSSHAVQGEPIHE